MTHEQALQYAKTVFSRVEFIKTRMFQQHGFPSDLKMDLSLDQFHDKVLETLPLSGIKCVDDIGMLQIANGQNLLLKPPDRVRADHIFAQQLHRAMAFLQSYMLCLVHNADAAAANDLQ